MSGWMSRLFGRQDVRVWGAARGGVVRAGVFGSVARPESDMSWSSGPGDGVIEYPNGTPFLMLDVYRHLRDSIPDISDAVWTWKRLCQTGYDIEIKGSSSDVASRRAMGLLDALNRRVNSGDRGMDGLPDVFLHFFVYVWGCCVGDYADSES